MVASTASKKQIHVRVSWVRKEKTRAQVRQALEATPGVSQREVEFVDQAINEKAYRECRARLDSGDASLMYRAEQDMFGKGSWALFDEDDPRYGPIQADYNHFDVMEEWRREAGVERW